MRIVRYYPRAATGDGGMTEALRFWASATTKIGAEVVIAHDGGTPTDAGDAAWISVRHVGPTSMRLPIGLEDVLRGADVVVLQSAWSGHNVRAAAVARRVGVPYVLEPRGAYDPHIVARRALLKRAWWIGWERPLVDRALAIHVFFDAEQPHLRSLGYHGPEIVVPNGVPDSTAPGWDGGSGGYVLWLGRFDPEHKGLDLLVSAVGRLPPERRPFVRLHGPDRRGGKARVARLIEAQGLQPWIDVGDAAYGDAKRQLMIGAIGFVYPSRWEAFGNAPAQAAALGVPTLVTPYPLGRYLAAHGAALLAQGTPDGIAAGLERLSTAEAVEVGRRGAEIVAQAFSWDVVARSWLDQVAALLAGRT
jgi:glycosyltransferase involved in cell wall biosynthesis